MGQAVGAAKNVANGLGVNQAIGAAKNVATGLVQEVNQVGKQVTKLGTQIEQQALQKLDQVGEGLDQTFGFGLGYEDQDVSGEPHSNAA